MAINPNISLQLQPLDVRSAISGAISQSEALRTRDIREQILQQQAQQNQMQQAQQKGAYINQLATGLMELPLDQRASVMAQQLPFLTEMGMSPAEVLKTNLTDDGLKGVLAQTNAFVSQSQQQAADVPADVRSFEHFLGIVEDPNATDEAKQAARIKLKTGLGASQKEWDVVTLADGTKFEQNIFTRETRPIQAPVAEQGQEGALTRETQVKQVAEAEAAEASAVSKVKVAEAEQLAQVALEKEQQEAQNKQIRADRQNAIEGGRAATESLVTIDRMIELNNKIQTGGITAGAKLFTDAFGVTPKDVGEFDILSKNLIAGEMRNKLLGSNPTEGERKFLFELKPSLLQSGDVNDVILKDMKRLSERMAGRQEMLVENPSMTIDEAMKAQGAFIPTNTNARPVDVVPETFVNDMGVLDTGSYIESLLQF